ncbi:MAG: 2,5-diamino-6-(ribosylamino)-4(3H)-pyrimidinone 5'-phosphate reductase [Candidatus Heimdallarchaeota archaeon]
MKRPYCILSSAISIDGKIATARTRDSALSSLEDWKGVHRLRNSVDAIMVGRGTVITDDPKLLVKKEFLPTSEELRHPIRVVTDSQAQISPEAKIFTKTSEASTIIVVCERASARKIRALEDRGAEVIICGKNKVDIKRLMEQLYERKVRKLMLEGGGQLNWSMFSLNLVDEIRLAIAPTVIGGSGAISLFEGKGYDQTNESPLLNLEEKDMFGDCIVLRYLVEHNKHRRKLQ